MFLSIGPAKIFTVSFGSKTNPVIAAIGGWTGSWELWAQPFSILSQSWYTLAYDHRGSGATLAPVETITFERLVDDVFAVLDAYGVERCVLAAESSGALTAFGAALRKPERIRGLVIVDGYLGGSPSGTTGTSATPENDAFVDGLRSAYPATLEGFVEACVPEPDSAHIKRWGRKILERASQDSAIALYQMGKAVDLRSQLHLVRQPTLILHGQLDFIVPVQESQWLAQTLPNASLSIINGAGHVPSITRPNEVAQEVTRFFGNQNSTIDFSTPV